MAQQKRRNTTRGKTHATYIALISIIVLLIALLVLFPDPSSKRVTERYPADEQPAAPGGEGSVSAPESAPYPPREKQPVAPGSESTGAGTGAGTEETEESASRDDGDTRPDVAAPAGEAARLSVVIDDAGYNLDQLEPFLELPFPVTIAVLPGLPYSEETARRARGAGKEVILHQPMEARGGNATGPGAIRLDHTDREIRAILKENLQSVPGAIGVNNHMGSAATADRRVMESVFGYLHEWSLFFLDSRTTTRTVAGDLAKDYGIGFLERDVFLDNERSRAYMESAVAEGIRTAETRGSAVLIGHVSSQKLASVLREAQTRYDSMRLSMVRLSQLLPGSGVRIGAKDARAPTRVPPEAAPQRAAAQTYTRGEQNTAERE